MSTIKPAAVAGMFYPADAAQLSTQVQLFLSQARGRFAPPKALIAPHAGYRYSGQAAAEAYASVAAKADQISRVVLLGPAHRVRLRGIAASSADYFETPLGRISLDRVGIAKAVEMADVGIVDQAFEQEHSLEVHLPFLQTLIPSFALLPFVVGDAGPESVSGLLEMLWGGNETLIVISSDLSHFHDYATAQGMDRRTTDQILALDGEHLSYEDACGRNPVRGLLKSARQRGMRSELAALCNSGDTAGDKSRVVGYGSYLFHAQ